ncbi:MAG: hypothetical protein O2817_08245 [Proteobacteria bacterium]|nr:hypothetical protein [Pseudomonadota bacterium]
MALEEKLAAANQENVGRAKRLAVLVCLAGLGVALFALSPSWTSTPLIEKINPSEKASPAPGAITAPGKAKPTVDQPTAITDRVAEPDKVGSTPKKLDCAASDQVDERCQRIRDNFKKELKAFEASFEPKLRLASVQQWSTDVHDKIFEHKQAALQAFSEGNYSSALDQIRAAAKESSKILKVKDARFDIHLKAAVSALGSNQFEIAQAEIASALLMSPDHLIAHGYRNQIELMPKVNGYLDGAYKARAENDLRSERSFLEKVIQLDTAREKEKTRLELLRKEIAEEDFANFMSKGIGAVGRRDVRTARTSMEKAQNFFPDRAELSFLKKRIERLDRELSVESSVNEANRAVSQDEWDHAYQAFSKAILIDPTNTAAIEGKRIADQVVVGRQGLDRYLERPDRLSSKAVAAAAQRLLASVQHLTAISPTLKVRSEQVSKLISQVNKPVEVVVKSDGKTEISVRRIGIVGKTLEKVINLRPGDYTFEGKRVGYKSKLVKLTVPFNGTGLEIKIICDEQI